MKIKIISYYANFLMLLGNFFTVLANNFLDKSFLLHMKYSTPMGKKLEQLQQIVNDSVTKTLKKEPAKEIKEDNNIYWAPGEYKAYWIKRKPQKDN